MLNNDYAQEKEEVGCILEEFTVPKDCAICGLKLVNPVVTRCRHFFCEKCALDHYFNSKFCFACHKPTNGIFNDATEQINVMKKKRQDKKNQIKLEMPAKITDLILSETDDSGEPTQEKETAAPESDETLKELNMITKSLEKQKQKQKFLRT